MGIFAKKQPQVYKIVNQDDEDKPFLMFEETPDRCHPRPTTLRMWISRLFWCMSIIGNIVLVSLLIALTYKAPLLTHRRTVDESFTYRSASFDTVVKQVNGSLFPTANMSWSRLAPSPEVDAFWNSFDPPRFIPLSEADMTRLGKDPSVSAQFPPEWNMPEGSYMGAVDVFHKMHCLNELRLAAFEYYPYGETKQHGPKDPLHYIHLRHCTDMLAQDLQCNAKLDIMTFNYMDTQENIYPDFSIHRTCTDWDQFVGWTEKNTVDSLDYPSMRVHPKGVKLIPAQDFYYETYGFGGSVLYPGGEGWTPQGN